MILSDSQRYDLVSTKTNINPCAKKKLTPNTYDLTVQTIRYQGKYYQIKMQINLIENSFFWYQQKSIYKCLQIFVELYGLGVVIAEKGVSISNQGQTALPHLATPSARLDFLGVAIALNKSLVLRGAP